MAVPIVPDSDVERYLDSILKKMKGEQIDALNIIPDSDVEEYLRAILDELINGGSGINKEIVTELPQTGDENTIYLVPNEDSEENNIYDEYIYISNSWEKIGSTSLGAELMTNVTYSELVDLRDRGQLIPGMQYRITDYETIINGSYDLSVVGVQGHAHYAGVPDSHPFDIIVTADDNYHLNENARAEQHPGDQYFMNSNLRAWKLKYHLDNDSSRYSWANINNGKGVIFWMEDEFNNCAGYDFKNIRFLRYALKQADATEDHSPTDTLLDWNSETQPNRYGTPSHVFNALVGYMNYGNYINPFEVAHNGIDLTDYDFFVGNNILGTIQFEEPNDAYLETFHADWYYTFDYYDPYSSIGDNGHFDASLNSSGSVKCYNNYIEPEFDLLAYSLESIAHGLGGNVWQANNIYEQSGEYVEHINNISGNHLKQFNWFNTFGNECYDNIFGNGCERNIFGNKCYDNIFENKCTDNIFENNNENNIFGLGSSANYFRTECSNNIFGGYCSGNIFYRNCNDNTFESNCHDNLFGDSCFLNAFHPQCGSNTFGSSCSRNTFSYYCQYNNFGDSCIYNVFGAGCSSNHFNTNSSYNKFSDGCTNNTFAVYCDHNVFGTNCTDNQLERVSRSNTFGDRSAYNTLLETCNNNILGKDCNHINLSNMCSNNTLGNICEYITFGNIVGFLEVSSNCKNINISSVQVLGSGLAKMENYDGVSGHATIIVKTGPSTETIVSTTDGGTNWA